MAVYATMAGEITVTYTYWEKTPPSGSTFNWGSGCGAGSGSFVLTLGSRETKLVGRIPVDKMNVKIELNSTNPEDDIDVTVFDTEDTGTYADGKAVVAWCNTQADKGRCNEGVLNSQGKQTASYKGMSIEYSGFGEAGKNPGNEYVTISGATTAELEMRAFGFQSGSATVGYTWEKSQTGCCLGTESCKGDFRTYVARDEITEIGTIPPGKLNLQISLSSIADLDIQLYDTNDTSAFPEGQAIVAFCVESGCNQGALFDNAGPMCTTYKSVEYCWSGYEGVGGKPGNEYLNITGETNVNLSMKILGYQPGLADIVYTYYEPQT